MRTRRPTQAKSYTFNIYGLSDSSNDDKEEDQSKGESSEDDEDLNVSPADESAEGSEEGDGDGIGDANEQDELQGPAGSDEEEEAPQTRDPNTLEIYPLASRQVRFYFGPFRRWAKADDRCAVWFGRHPEDWNIVDSIDGRWRRCSTLPGRSSNRGKGPIHSPWMPVGFEEAQIKVCSEWYRGYQHHTSQSHESRRQTWRLLSENDAAEPYNIRAEGNLMTLLGPHHQQVEHVTQQNTGTAISPSGVPISEDAQGDVTSAAWLLDVGGLVLAMGWMPRPSFGIQFLALAVSPHSDQAPHNREDLLTPAEDRKHGIVQLWKFVGEKVGQGLIRPSNRAPQLSLVLCFDWGRATKLQWCPIRLISDSTSGLLAVLCSDEQLRVIEVPVLGQEDRTIYRSCPAIPLRGRC
jgi:transcription factor C subunit 6